MKEYQLFVDFTSLDKKNAGKWVASCSSLAEEVFRNSGNKTRVLGNILIVEQYFHTLEQGLKQNGKKPQKITYKMIDTLWDYLYGTIAPTDFEYFANQVYACVLHYMVGEELTEKQIDFYKNNFSDDINSVDWEIISWACYILLEILSIHGGKVCFDEFDECDFVDFVQVDEMLNILNDVCTEFAGIPCPSHMAKDVIKAMEDVYETSLFQSIVCKVQKSLKDAFYATEKDYKKLREEYRHYGILPEEFAADFVNDSL